MYRVLTLTLIGFGIFVRTYQYLDQGSMWLDELAIAHTVVVRDIGRLITEPLAYRQVAPAGFLALEKAAVTFGGAGELGFHFVPWLASIAALFVFAAVAARLLSRGAAVTTLALFASSPALAWFGSQAKQYSTDVLGVLLVIWAGAELLSARPRAARAVAAGVAAILLSMPSVLTAASVGIVVLIAALRRGAPSRHTILAVGASWTAAALATASLAQMALTTETRDYMRMFWAHGFLPAPTNVDALLWTPRVLADALSFGLFFTIPDRVLIVRATGVVLALLTLPGVWWLGRRRGYETACVVSPVVVGLAASAGRLLPIDGRVSLWLLVPLLILAGGGLSALLEWLWARARPAAIAIPVSIAGVGLASVSVLDRPPYRSQDVRPVLQRVASQAQPNDAIYVYFGARLALRYYGPGAGISRWTEGNCHRRHTVEYFRELDAFRGRDRVWVIWSHAIPRFGEPKAIESYLSTIGTERLRINPPYGVDGSLRDAQALLYDLSDPARLASTTADLHQIPPPDRPGEGPDVPCGGPANDASVVR